MSADNAFVQGLRNMTYSAGEAPSYQYCLGVLTKGNIPEGYLNVISEENTGLAPAICKQKPSPIFLKHLWVARINLNYLQISSQLHLACFQH